MSVEPTGDRVQRAAMNQSMFRQVNEHLQGIAESFQQVAAEAKVACECAAVSCVEQVEMSMDEYETVRGDGNSFVVLPGHVYPDVESVVSENERFVVVAKVGPGEQLARELNPRLETASVGESRSGAS